MYKYSSLLPTTLKHQGAKKNREVDKELLSSCSARLRET
jgi:hypothetical protein